MHGISAVRYAESITLHVELQPDQSDGLIRPPYFEIQYNVASSDDFKDDAVAEVSITT